MARHVGAGIAPDVRMFTELFRIVADHELSVSPEIAGAFRALATIEGTLTRLAPGFDLLLEARRFAVEQVARQLSPAALRRSATDELISLVPMLRRLPRGSTGSATRWSRAGSASTCACSPSLPTAATSRVSCTSWC